MKPESDGVVVHRLRSGLGWLSPVITQQTGRPGVKARQLRAVFERDFDVRDLRSDAEHHLLDAGFGTSGACDQNERGDEGSG